MPPVSTHGYLLSITPLTSNDAMLTFYTQKHGKVSCFSKGFQNSRKKKLEIDYFRLLEIDLFQGRNNFQLRSVRTIAVFHEFSKNYKTHQWGFQLLQKIQKISPELHADPDFWKIMSDILAHYEEKHEQVYTAYLFSQLLLYLGLLPRFDLIRSDVFICSLSGRTSLQKIKNSDIFISNTSRQVLEFFRRTSPGVLQQKIQNIPESNTQEVLHILWKIWKFNQISD